MLAFYIMEFPPSPNSHGKGALRLRDKRIFSRAVSDSGAATKRNDERGAGTLKAIIWTMILVALIYVAAMTLPVLINDYQFQDSLQSIARYASVNRRNNDQVRKAVLDEALKEDLPILAENIKVEGNAGKIHIHVDYSVAVDLKVYQWTLTFHPDASNAALF